MLFGDKEQKTNIRIKIVEDLESYNKAMDVDYDSEDVMFTRWLDKLDRPDFNKVNRSQNGKDFRQDIVEYIGNICYFPTSCNCFVKCSKYLAVKDYMNDFSTVIRGEQRRSNFVTRTRVQLSCDKHKINIDCYDECRVCPRNVAGRNIALHMYKNQFCSTWKTQGNSFNRSIEQ